MRAELLKPDEVVLNWPVLEPLYRASCESCEITRDLMDAEDIKRMALKQECHVFAFYDGDGLQFTMAIQFAMAMGKKVAYIIGMAGQNMRRFLSVYWPYLQDWMRDNGAKAVYTDAHERNAKIYMKKYGFSKSTVKLGLDL